MHFSDDEIQQFFDGLSADDFRNAPADTADTKTEAVRPIEGPEDFRFFANYHLFELFSNRTPVIVTHDGTIERLYRKRANEHTGDWVLRVARDIADSNVKYVFAGMPGRAASGTHDNTDPSFATGENTVEVINWYAESIEESSKSVRYGGIGSLDGSGEEIVMESTNPNGASPTFQHFFSHSGSM